LSAFELGVAEAEMASLMRRCSGKDLLLLRGGRCEGGHSHVCRCSCCHKHRRQGMSA
jgi:hypothetical protein